MALAFAPLCLETRGADKFKAKCEESSPERHTYTRARARHVPPIFSDVLTQKEKPLCTERHAPWDIHMYSIHIYIMHTHQANIIAHYAYVRFYRTVRRRCHPTQQPPPTHQLTHSATCSTPTLARHSTRSHAPRIDPHPHQPANSRQQEQRSTQFTAQLYGSLALLSYGNGMCRDPLAVLRMKIPAD